jgi:hypothetical protein
MPAVVATAVVALAAGCSWIQPSNQVLADQGESTTPSSAPSQSASPAATSPSASASVTSTQPVWAQALGAGVVVTAPATATPGTDSPGAAVQGDVDALNAGSLTQSCMYTPPSAQANCQTAMAARSASDVPTVQNFVLGYVAVDGNEALVGSTGTFCAPDQTPACVSNDDPAAIFEDAKPFPELWTESIAAGESTTNSYSLIPCIYVDGAWYIYNTGAGGNS